MKTASVIATIVTIAVLVIFIAPQIDLDPSVPAGTLFLSLLLAFGICAPLRAEIGNYAGSTESAVALAALFLRPSDSIKVQTLRC